MFSGIRERVRWEQMVEYSVRTWGNMGHRKPVITHILRSV